MCAKAVDIKNIVMGKRHIREDLHNADMMKVQRWEQYLINVNFHCK